MVRIVFSSCSRLLCLLLLVCIGGLAQAATWQYAVPYDRGLDKKGQPQAPGTLYLWLPPQSQTVRGLFICGSLGIEGELTRVASVRQACAENDIAIAYFVPHISGTFHFWADGNTDGQRWLKALDAAAKASGHPELARVPWITAGHSTAGIFCRNVAYWKPDRVAAIVHIKSGNFFQQSELPPTGSLAGIPLVAINGQYETFGPAGVEQPDAKDGRLDQRYGRETQWTYVRRDVQLFRAKNPEHLFSQFVQAGDDHFHGAPELYDYVALFLRKTAQYRLPKSIPSGTAPVPCRTVKATDGWLIDPDIKHPANQPAAYAQYAGDKAQAMWVYDKEMADATLRVHRNMGTDQVLSNPVCTWLDEGDGWTFTAKSDFLDAMPASYCGPLAGKTVGHAGTPIEYRCKPNEPVEQIGPNRFRLLRPTKSVSIAAFNPGDATYRSTIRWGSLEVPQVKGEKQTITFAPIPDLHADAKPYKLLATASSGLPVYYEASYGYGPVEVKDGMLVISELPTHAQFPIECKVTAYQMGRRTGEPVAPAEPVTVTFNIIR